MDCTFKRNCTEVSGFLSGTSFILIASIQNHYHDEALSKFIERKRSLISTWEFGHKVDVKRFVYNKAIIKTIGCCFLQTQKCGC